MPNSPLRYCAVPGCKSLVPSGTCLAHTNRDNHRHHSMYGRRWRKYRVSYLADNPVCVICVGEGRHVPATIVDHITPHQGDMELFWDGGNHQPLCKTCHDRKTARDDGGFGR